MSLFLALLICLIPLPLAAEDFGPAWEAAEAALKKIDSQSVIVKLDRKYRPEKQLQDLIWIRGAGHPPQLAIDSFEMRQSTCSWSRMTMEPAPTPRTRRIGCQELMILGQSLDLIRNATVYGALNSNPTLSPFAVAPSNTNSRGDVSIPPGDPMITASMAGILNLYFSSDYGFIYGYASYGSLPKPQIMMQYDASVELIDSFMAKSRIPWQKLLKTDAQRLFNFALRVSNYYTLADEHQDYNDENKVNFVKNKHWWWVRESMLTLAGTLATKQSIPQLTEMRSYLRRNMTQKDNSIGRSLPELDRVLKKLEK
jgi:hypothetical protein